MRVSIFGGVFVVIRKSNISQPQPKKDDLQFQRVFEEAGDAIFIYDIKGSKILAVNNMACKQLGYDKEKLLSMEPNQIDTPEQRINQPERICKVLKNGYESFETMHLRKDGT
ncbi:MAG: PAS domain S-box protein, partial [Bacteroidales bacterium]|nr:PAS domain S-box protein [Bacteroidales bacterium]